MTNEIVKADTGEIIQVEEAADARVERLKEVARTLKGPDFVSDIQGKLYPRAEWWTTVAAHAGLTALESGSRKVTCADHEGRHYGYESTVEVTDVDGVIRSRASMICLSCEVRSKRTGSTWGDNGEYAVKSMSLTRATSKAFRINLSYLTVMTGLQPTPAEEVSQGEFSNASRRTDHGTCPEHGMPYLQSKNMSSPAHPIKDADGNLTGWCNKPGNTSALDDAAELDQQAQAHLGEEATEMSF